jgi:hypothetical protein
MIRNLILTVLLSITFFLGANAGYAAVVLSEDFEGSAAGWTIIDNNGRNVNWSFNNPENRTNYTGGGGNFAIADSDHYGNKDMDTELRTPLLDLSSATTASLEFKTDFYTYTMNGTNETADVDVSVNGETGPWTTIWQKTSDYFGPVTEVIDISSIAAGQANVMVRFHYYNAKNDWWWQIDDVIISIGTTIMQYRLTTSVSSPGAGSVSPDCSGGCLYDRDTVVVLTAHEDSGYPFNSWTGCDNPNGSICTMTMDADKSVTAVFASCMYPVRVKETSYYSSSLQNAYDNAGSGNTIQSQNTTIIGDLHIDGAVSITFEGGYDCDYSAVSGTTTVIGNMTISNGTITIQSGTLEVQ